MALWNSPTVTCGKHLAESEGPAALAGKGDLNLSGFQFSPSEVHDLSEVQVGILNSFASIP